MKRNVLYAALALVALYSCSSEENIGVVTPSDDIQNAAAEKPRKIIV